MPFDQWYDSATREAATARALQRKMTNPTDRNVLTVVAEEFNVPRQTLSDWVDEASPDTAKPSRKRRPKFSQVVKTTKVAPAEPVAAAELRPAEAVEAVEPMPAEAVEAAEESTEVTEPAAALQPTAASDPQPMREPEPDPWADAADDESDVESEPYVEFEPESDVEPEPAAEPAPESDAEPAPGLDAEPALDAAAAPAPSVGTIAALEAEVAALRSGNRTLVAALSILVEAS